MALAALLTALRRHVVTAVLLAACAAPASDPGDRGTRLYVANALDGTITRIDGERGRTVGLPLPAGPTPWQIARGPSGDLLVLSMSAAHVGELTHIFPAGSHWATRPVPVGARTRQTLLAGDGSDRAVVAYSAWPSGGQPTFPACGLDLVDLRAGRVVRTLAVCAPGEEAVTGLAFESGPAGAIAYLGISRPEPALPGGHVRRPGGGNRLVAIDADTGALLAALPLAGLPSNLVLAPASGREPRRLYGVEAPVAPDPEQPTADRSRLLGLNPTTFRVERDHQLGFRPSRLAVGPEGGNAYAIASDGTRLMHVDLMSGVQHRLADVQGSGASLAVSAERIYVTHPYGNALHALDRRRGEVVATIPVGRRPAGIILADAG